MNALPPLVVGLTICRDYLRDAETGLVNVIRSFSGHAVGSFPAESEPICVCALLTNGRGECRTQLVVTFFGENECYEFARLRNRIQFPGPLHLVEYLQRIDRFPFPEPGVYLFTLLINDERMAQKSLRVYSTESTL